MEPAVGSSPIIASVAVLLGSDGAIGVSGPLHDPEWCLRALRAGEAAVVDRFSRIRRPLPRAADGGVVVDLRKPFAPTTDATERVLVASVQVGLRADGGIETFGPIDDLEWTLDMLRRGIDAVSHHKIQADGKIVIPAPDAAMPAHRPLVDRGGSTLVGGPPGVEVEYGSDELEGA